ncbi:MAG: hypothetical protein EXR70_12615 [Deltaproteobacteria bacterium]|nr:hypothetical protein [Deltaproteobacteria bacterium]
MLVDPNWTLNAENLSVALKAATSLFDRRWIANQRGKRPNYHLTQGAAGVDATWGQIDDFIKHSAAGKTMHPLAESIFASESALAEFSKTGVWFEDRVFYQVISLAHVASFSSLIPGAAPRLAKLIGTEWRSALYELLVACSYRSETLTEFIKETNSPTPDIRLMTNPNLFVECKGRQKYEEIIEGFIRTWRRESLARIDQVLRKYHGSFLVRITLLSPQDATVYQKEIPEAISTMIESGLREHDATNRYSIAIEPWAEQIILFPRPVTHKEVFDFLPFDEWDEWHYILPYGHLKPLASDTRMFEGIRQWRLICVRADYLKDNRVSLLATLKDLCKRQFREYQPGIVHMATNSVQFGLGRFRRPETIVEILKSDFEVMFRNYDRIWKIIIDVTCGNEWKGFTEVLRVQATRKSTDSPAGYVEPKRIFLV